MPTSNNQIRITELDYDQILQNLVAFMKTDPAFADYDFSGSGLRLLSRVLAYVTFYQAYYLNAAVNESFLDTAQLRSSVSSHGRSLGYAIHGVQSASVFANVSLTVADSSALQITVPKNTQFAFSGNNQYTFYNTSDITTTLNATSMTYEAGNVSLVEGRPLNYQFTVDQTNPSQRFIIPNANVDYNRVSVIVQASASSNLTTNFKQSTTYLNIKPTDAVFFVEETSEGFPELIFGNGVLGLALNQSNVIRVSYYISRGPGGNGINGPFQIFNSTINGLVSGVATVAAPSSGGSEPENLDDVRFLAPKSYQAQNRCVTVDDYKTIILREYGSHIAAINVFGGEQGDPNDIKERPIFGKVFIVLKPNVGLQFTDVEESYIQNQIVAPRNVVGIIPEIIAPDYAYIICNSLVKYDPKATTLSSSQLTSDIEDNIKTYAQNNIEKFDTSFRFSKLARTIDDTDESILSSLTRLDLEKRFFPVLNQPNQFILKFRTPLRKSGNASAILEASSNRFSYADPVGNIFDDCFLYEQAGSLEVAYRDSNNTIQVVTNQVGSIDIQSGLVTINNFSPISIENNESDIRIRVTPTITDFTPHLNQLFTLDPLDVKVLLITDASFLPAEQLAFFQGGLL
jgi:hypothetical protein